MDNYGLQSKELETERGPRREWVLAQAQIGGRTVAAKSRTGANGSAPAAVFNFGGEFWSGVYRKALARALRNGVQYDPQTDGSLVVKAVVQLHALTHEEGIAREYSCQVAGWTPAHKTFAISDLADQIAVATRRGLYSGMYTQGWRPAAKASEGEPEAAEDLAGLAEIKF